MAPARDQNRRRVRSGDRHPDRTVAPADEPTGPREHVRQSSPFYSATEEAFKNKRTMRFLSAGAIALVLLIVVALFGPSREEVKRRFENYGAEGPLEIMPDISIDDGSDPIAQLPEAFLNQSAGGNHHILTGDVRTGTHKLIGELEFCLNPLDLPRELQR